LGCDIVDLDYPAPVSEARTAMGPRQVLLGNMDPVAVLRNSNPHEIEQCLACCHAAAGARYIVGAGCEIPRDTPVEHVRQLARYARSHDVRINSSSPAS
jgi:uroporphyrinogen-III decarboxylase